MAYEGTSDKVFLQRIYTGLGKQFSGHVIDIANNSVRLRNFMDGHNGIYRYEYSTVGTNELRGYGPYGLSGIMGEGWYAFLPNMNSTYGIYAQSYPLSGGLLDLYVGPNTTRSRNNLYVWPQFFTSGFSEMIAYQSLALTNIYSLTESEVSIPRRRDSDGKCGNSSWALIFLVLFAVSQFCMIESSVAQAPKAMDA